MKSPSDCHSNVILWARYPEHHNIRRDTMTRTKELLKNIPECPSKNKEFRRGHTRAERIMAGVSEIHSIHD